MAEHLTPTGRAGIIVPEGVIFQSQNAYTQLRKMLVDNFLVAVVSLPAGVFQPYSGVKTSILILDTSLARQADTIGFFKVTNDGFGLGAQRRAIDKDDLPQARTEIAEYLRRLRARESLEDFQPALGLIVAKEKVAANGDYNLSRERYREGAASDHSFPLIYLGEAGLFRVESGGTPKSDVEEYWGGTVPWATLVDLPATDFISQITTSKRTISEQGLRASSAKMIPANLVVVSTRATIGRIAINRVPNATNQGFKNIIVEDPRRVIPEFVALALTKLVPTMQAWATGGIFAEISKSKFCELGIPLPPLAVQKEIVAEIEGCQKVIDGARAVIDNYRPHIPVDSKWPIVPLEVACEIQRGKFSHRPRNEPRFYGGRYPFIQTGDIVRAKGGKIKFTQTLNDDGLSVSKLFQPPVVVLTIAANIGDTAVLDFPSCFPDSVVALIPKPATNAWYLEVVMRTKKQHLNDIAPQSAQKNINIEILKTVEVPLPPLAAQQSIVAEIEAEQALVNANRKLIARFELMRIRAIHVVEAGPLGSRVCDFKDDWSGENAPQHPLQRSKRLRQIVGAAGRGYALRRLWPLAETPQDAAQEQRGTGVTRK